VFEDSATLAHGSKRGRETAAVVAWSVVLAAPTLEIDVRQIRPELARRVRYDRSRAGIPASVALDGPHVRQQDRVRASRIDEKRSHRCHNPAAKLAIASGNDSPRTTGRTSLDEIRQIRPTLLA